MAAVYTSANFANAYEYRRRSLSYPFRDDPTLGTIITRYFEVVSSSHTAPVLNTVDTEFTSAYCIGARPVQHVDGELMRYEVEFATIPAMRSEFETYSFRYPGFFTVETLGASINIDGIFVHTGNQSATRNVGSGHGLANNDIVLETLTLDLLSLKYSTRVVRVNRYPVSQVTVSGYSAPIYLPPIGGYGWSFRSGTMQKIGTSFGSRGPQTRIATSRRQIDYYLPGVTAGISTPKDITLEQPIQFVNATGTEVDILTSLTSPTQAQYTTGIIESSEFPVESFLRSWRGNIYEREVRYLPYE